MIRVVNFFCVALTAFACLALNHVSDQTRVAQAQLKRAKVEIAAAADVSKILQTDWERASNPAHIQALAAAHLGLADTATVEVASLEMLPRRGETAPPASSGISTASAELPVPSPRLHLVLARTGN